MENARTFTTRLAGLLSRERAALGEFLVILSEFDAQQLWRALGYSSLFDFLHRELHLSKGAAFYRKTAVALIQRFPAAIEPLRDGRLCLMTVAEVARVLTPENSAEVLPRFFHLSKREAQALAAGLMPREAPPLRGVVTPLRVVASAPVLALSARSAATSEASATPVEPDAVGSVQPVELARPSASRSLPTPPPPRTTPLTADLSRLNITVSRRFLDKLEAAHAALSHSHPGASADEILEAGLDLLLARDAKRKGLVEKPRKTPPASTDPDHVPAHVRRAVWKRDGGRCQWPLASGGVCASTLRVQLDHRIARARGGPPTVDNLRCLCAVHNDLAAREVFGDACMDRYTRGRSARTSERGSGAPVTTSTD